jgi:hypothetical protein
VYLRSAKITSVRGRETLYHLHLSSRERF